MDALLICGSNVLFENFAAFAVFGVVGYLERWPTDGVRLGAFVVGFLTLPEAVLQMVIGLSIRSALSCIKLTYFSLAQISGQFYCSSPWWFSDSAPPSSCWMSLSL
jgi:hypothetical protein